MSTGAAGGDAGQTTQGEAQGENGGGDAPSTAQIAEMLAAQQSSQQEMFQYLQSEPWRQQEAAPEEAQQESPELDLSFLDMDDPSYDPNTIAQRLGGLIDQTVEQRLQQGIAPLQQQQEEMRRQSEVQALVGEFPEFGDPETGKAVLQMAGQLAEAHGQPELAQEPWFWRVVYMAGRAADAAQDESGEIPAAAHLEGGAGAAPAGGGQDMGDLIVGGGRRGAGVLPFSGIG
jgi:hypothetical protein